MLQENHCRPPQTSRRAHALSVTIKSPSCICRRFLTYSNEQGSAPPQDSNNNKVRRFAPLSWYATQQMRKANTEPAPLLRLFPFPTRRVAPGNGAEWKAALADLKSICVKVVAQALRTCTAFSGLSNAAVSHHRCPHCPPRHRRQNRQAAGCAAEVGQTLRATMGTIGFPFF